MIAQQVPRRLRKAIEWVEADPARAWTVREIAAACGVPPRTLQRQFRRYMGQMLMAFVRDLRLNHARVEMLRSCGAESVTEIAVRCGFTHLGRFAVSYRTRYGESPSATLRRHQNTSTGGDIRPSPLSLGIERPRIAVLPFDLAAPDARHATDLTDDIIAALMRTRWIAVSIPANARYHLRGKIWGDGIGRVRVTLSLSMSKPADISGLTIGTATPMICWHLASVSRHGSRQPSSRRCETLKSTGHAMRTRGRSVPGI